MQAPSPEREAAPAAAPPPPATLRAVLSDPSRPAPGAVLLPSLQQRQGGLATPAGPPSPPPTRSAATEQVLRALPQAIIRRGGPAPPPLRLGACPVQQAPHRALKRDRSGSPAPRSTLSSPVSPERGHQQHLGAARGALSPSRGHLHAAPPPSSEVGTTLGCVAPISCWAQAPCSAQMDK